MKILQPKIALLLGVMVSACTLAPSASAAYLHPWNTALSPTDPDNDSLYTATRPYTEIMDMWFAKDASYYYFRMDVAGAVSDSQNAWDFNIWIDTDNNAATGSQETTIQNSPYIDGTLDGIDNTLSVHYSLGSLSSLPHLHPYTSTSPWVTSVTLASEGGFFQDTENGNKTLEWRIPISVLGTSQMKIYGGVHDRALDLSPDITAGYVINGNNVPEPASFLLMSVGAAAAGFARRRQSRQG